jgi:GAF domain-containing protein
MNRHNSPGSPASDSSRARQEILELRQLVGELQLRNVALAERLRDTQESADTTAAAICRLESERDSLKQEMNRLSGDLALIESQHANLTSLYVAADQLHGTMNREAVLNAIQEIVINFIGSEDFSVYEKTDRHGLRSIAHVGRREHADPHTVPDVADAVESGEPYISDEAESRVAACIPLKVDDKTIGAIAIYRLLPHKAAFEPFDLELFNLLKTHAAAALMTTSRRSGDDTDRRRPNHEHQ